MLTTTLSHPRTLLVHSDANHGQHRQNPRSTHGTPSFVNFPRRPPHHTCGHHRIAWSSGYGAGAPTPKGEPVAKLGYCASWSADSVAASGASWLRKLFRNGNQRDFFAEGDNQRVAVVDVHFRLSLSEPKRLADFAPRWMRVLKGMAPWLSYPSQDGGGGFSGGGNRNGNPNRWLSYGGDDEDEGARSRRGSLYQWWATGVAGAAALVWTLGVYSGAPRRPRFSVAEFVDCVLWLGLLWCAATCALWAARMAASLMPTGPGNGVAILRRRSAFSLGREFLIGSRFDERMARNVAAVPGLVVSLFLASDLVHYGRSLGLARRLGGDIAWVLDRVTATAAELAVKVRRGRRTVAAGVAAEKKWRREFGAASSRGRRP